MSALLKAMNTSYQINSNNKYDPYQKQVADAMWLSSWAPFWRAWEPDMAPGNKQTNINFILYRNRETGSKIHKELQKSPKSQGSEAPYFLN